MNEKGGTYATLVFILTASLHIRSARHIPSRHQQQDFRLTQQRFKEEDFQRGQTQKGAQPPLWVPLLSRAEGTHRTEPAVHQDKPDTIIRIKPSAQKTNQPRKLLQYQTTIHFSLLSISAATKIFSFSQTPTSPGVNSESSPLPPCTFRQNLW